MKKITNDEVRDIAIRCTDKLVLNGFIKNCIDTNKNDEFNVQDIIQNEINRALEVKEEK